MQVATIEQLRPGLVVATPVTNEAGAVLCPMGFKLTDDAINRLRSAGVRTLEVEGSLGAGPAPGERIKALEARFKGIDDPLLLTFKKTLERYFRGACS